MLECAIIPARGGSRGLPGKNIRPLGGLPLIAWTIRAALASDAFARVIVSTEDAAIAEAARDAGAEVPFLRPAELATDTATSRDVVLHALEELSASKRFALLQPTSPFRNAEHIRQAAGQAAMLDRGTLISVMAAKPASWLLSKGSDGALRPALNRSAAPRRQDEADLLQPNGAMYFHDADEYRRAVPAGVRVQGFMMGTIDSLDIDTAEDFALAEAVVGAGLRTVDG